jgi:hypothetical protein
MYAKIKIHTELKFMFYQRELMQMGILVYEKLRCMSGVNKIIRRQSLYQTKNGMKLNGKICRAYRTAMSLMAD